MFVDGILLLSSPGISQRQAKFNEAVLRSGERSTSNYVSAIPSP